MDLCLVVPDSTPPPFANSQLVSLPPVGIFNKFLLSLQYLFACFSVHNKYSSARTLRHLNKVIYFIFIFMTFTVPKYSYNKCKFIKNCLTDLPTATSGACVKLKSKIFPPRRFSLSNTHTFVSFVLFFDSRSA